MGPDRLQSHDPIAVIADDRERNSSVASFLKAMTHVDLRVERLAIGDYRIDNHLVFERKTLQDFSRSIIDGRLFRQMIRLANADTRGVLILEGTGKDLDEVALRREAMQGALITVSLTLGIPVLRARHPEETARLMVYAARQARPAEKRGVPRRGPKPKGRHRHQLNILEGLPGIGREKAQRLLQTFGSVEAVFIAGRNQLQAIAGIGAKTAEKIRWVVSEYVLPYGSGDDWPI